MEVGVQSGGKIPLLRDYFGPGFEYVGIDINPSTTMFDNGDWAHIEIGDSEDPTFLKNIQRKYPHVDIFLDDGSHTMQQQRLAMELMLPHVQPEGVYAVEDLATSWNKKWGGMENADCRNSQFLETTMWGMIHTSLDWFMSDWIRGGVMKPYELHQSKFPDRWWKTVPNSVKHIHIYNQIVVYEKGLTHRPNNIVTVDSSIPVPPQPSGTHPKTDWTPILKKLQAYTGSTWIW
jgi:hypothetical protein